MTRHRFLFGLFGSTAEAAAPKPKPKPNRCPVCGTMAELYTPVLNACGKPWAIIESEERIISVCDSVAKSRLIRCRGCNAAWWQDMA